jgi:hypothetical protein
MDFALSLSSLGLLLLNACLHCEFLFRKSGRGPTSFSLSRHQTLFLPSRLSMKP